MVVMAAVLALASMVTPPQNAPIGKLNNKVPKVMFKLSGNGKTKGEFVLEPLLPTSIFGIISASGGEQPKAGDIFTCTAGSKTLGVLLNAQKEPSTSTTRILVLDCGKYTFFIEGIQFTPED